MLNIRDYSIKKKLTLMNMLVSGATLLLACTAFGAYELTAHSDDVDQSFRFDADQIGAKRRRALSV